MVVDTLYTIFTNIFMTWWNSEKYNIIGKRFNSLTVIEQLNTKGPRRFLCRCDCGKTNNVSRNNLVTGKVKTCGYHLKGCHRKKPYEWLYNSLLADAKKHQTDITYEDFIEFTKIKNYHYCHIDIIWQEYSCNKKYNTRSYNLDRKDSNKGYFKNNVVVCCARCNRAKLNHFTYEEFLKIGEVIKNFAR